MTNGLNAQQWVNQHADYLYSFAISRLNNEEQAKDLVQDTFLAALQKVDTFEGKASERTWLTAILKNKIIDVYRKKSSGLKIVSESHAMAEQEVFFEEDGHWSDKNKPLLFGIESDDKLSKQEFNSILKKCLEKLPPLWYAVFTMKVLEEETSENVCKELMLSSSNLWVIVHRAKVNLRACLQKNWL
jgi:RNA polymerase sigma-70 factor (ECF subfamily)